MAEGLLLISDLNKMRVCRLAEHVNRRVPSAELAEDQRETIINWWYRDSGAT